ncbi:MAG: cupin domain-containing protein [Eggerthellaceae bacterium]
MPVFRNRETQRVENVNGGEGAMIRDRLLNEEQIREFGGECTYLAQITVEPHSSLGIHEHAGEGELYFITSGSALYVEDDVEYEVSAGDALFCASGSTHGIKNPGDEVLTFVAVIMQNK